MRELSSWSASTTFFSASVGKNSVSGETENSTRRMRLLTPSGGGGNVNSWRSRFILSKIVVKQAENPIPQKFDVFFSFSLKVIIESSCVKFRITVDLLLQLIKADDLFR